MAGINKLDQDKERELAVAAFCGVANGFLRNRYDLSKSTISANILGKRSKEWNDDLVEFYRSNFPKEKDRNFAHLFLSFNTGSDYEALPSGLGSDYEVLPSELIVRGRDLNAEKVVENAIYVPGIEGVLDRTALREYVGSTTPYNNLVMSVFGTRFNNFAEGIARGVFVDSLKKHYSPEDPLALGGVFDETGTTIIDKVKEGGLAWSLYKKELVHKSLENLTERERDVLGMIFGLDGYEGPKILRETGEVFDVSAERIRQIEAKALRKLKHPSRSRNLRAVSGLATDEDVRKYMDKIRYQEERAKSDSPLNIPISNVELSVRMANCFEDDDIRYIGELVQKTEAAMLRLPNFGRKSLHEIREILAHKYGLHLGMDVDFKRPE